MRLAVRPLVALVVGAASGCGLILDFGDEPRARTSVDASAADGSGEASGNQPSQGNDGASDAGVEPGTRAVYFRMEGYGGAVFRVRAEEGAAREDIGALLRANNGPAAAGFDPLTMYEYRDLTVSHGGAVFALKAGRYSPTGEESFYVGKPGEWRLTKVICSAIAQPGTNEQPAGRALITTDGKRVVFEHGYDMTGTGARREGIWVAPITGSTTCGVAEQVTPEGAEYILHGLGSVSRDDKRVVTRCRHIARPTALCEQPLSKPYDVKTLFTSDRVDAGHVTELGFPSYDIDGSVLFSAQWHPGVPNRSQVYRYRAPSTFEKLTPESGDNFDPCSFANGDIAMKAVEDGKMRIRIIKKTGGEYMLDVVTGAEELSTMTGLYCSG